MVNGAPRRVVLVGPARPYRGGIAQFTDSMARGLRHRGHDVSVVTFSRQYPKRLFPGRSQYEPEDGRGAEAARLIDSLNPLSWRTTGRRIADDAPHVVIFEYWLPFFAPAFAAIARRVRKRSPGTRILAVAHNVLPHERRPGDATLARHFLRACDAIVVLSTAVALDARDLLPQGDIRTLCHPVYDHFGEAMPREQAREHLGLGSDAEVMLFFGFVREYKGLHVLLEAMPQIVVARPRAKLVVAGEFYEDYTRSTRLIKQYGLDDRVQLVDHYIPDADVAVYFSAADVVVQPYVSATQSGVVQTAFHFDRPVIVTDVGGLADVAAQGVAGLVVEPNAPAALASACVRFFEEHLAEELASGVRREKARYEWDQFLSAIEEMPGFQNGDRE